MGLGLWGWRGPAVDAGWFQRTDLPSAIASDSQLPHGGQCGSQESNAEVKLASLRVFFFSRRSFWKSGLRTGGLGGGRGRVWVATSSAVGSGRSQEVILCCLFFLKTFFIYFFRN